MTKQSPLPKTGIELRTIIREEVRNELTTVKVDLVDSFTKIATDFKSKILDSVDEVLGEVKKGREEQEVQAYKIAEHDDRIEKLEQLHPKL